MLKPFQIFMRSRPQAMLMKMLVVTGVVVLQACTQLPQAGSALAVSGAVPSNASASATTTATLDAQAPIASSALHPLPSSEHAAGNTASASQRVRPGGPPRDLWERLRQGFTLPPLQGDAALRSQQLAQSYARSGLLQRSAARAKLYLYPFVAEAEKRGLPLELALLPYVESALNPNARSPVGAVGACQFMPATGKRFDLAQSTWVDQRRDVSRCANAMFDYLAENYARLGSWHLALAAYNWGEGAVARAMEKNRAAGLGTGFEDLRMPRETQNYVPALLGLAAVVDEPAQWDVSLPSLPNLPSWVDVALPADMDVRRVLQLAGVSKADFERLNPGIFRPVIPKAVQASIALPPDAAQRFTLALAHQRLPLATWGAWRVPRTQRLAQIAKVLGTQPSTLAQANDIPLGHLVLAGSVLAVPKSGQQDIDSHSASEGVLRTTLPPQAKKKKAAPGAGKSKPPPSAASRATPKNSGTKRIQS